MENEKSIKEKKRVPTALTIHDLSCFGRCALTVIIPTLSAMGVQTVPIPTALLSTHTGGFEGFHFRDMTEDMERIAAHLKDIDVECDAVYTGFLGSEEQINTVSRIIDSFRLKQNGEKAPVLVDPVMGDDGRLYSTYTHGMMLGMRRLCEKADVITPNLTEACFLTDTRYIDTKEMTETEALGFAKELCGKMAGFGARYIVITGLHFGSNYVGTYGCDLQKGVDSGFICASEHIDRSYPGTGDLFASVLLGELMRERDFCSAVGLASDFTRRTIEYTAGFDTPIRNGVAFEALLCQLWHE